MQRWLSWLRSIALRFVVAVPTCLCVYGWVFAALRCAENWDSFCVTIIIMAPIFILSGPIAHDEEDPPNHYPAILFAAAIVTLAWTIVAAARRRWTLRDR